MENLEVSDSVTNKKAITSLILGVASILMIPRPLLAFALGIIGFIFGFIGLREIKRFDHKGKGIAISGIVCSSLTTILPTILLLIGFIIFMRAFKNVY